MPEPAKILAVDDEADFELLIRQRFRHQVRSGVLFVDIVGFTRMAERMPPEAVALLTCPVGA